MRNKLSLRNCAIFVTLVAVTLMIGLCGTTNRPKNDAGNGAISLEAPLFISVAEAQMELREEQPAPQPLRVKPNTGAGAFPVE